MHALVYVSLTQKCPLRCRHCFVDSGPERKESIDEEALDRFLIGLCADPDTEFVLFSGGEPFSHPHALRRGLDICARSQVGALVGTSGYWARDRDAGIRFLRRFPGIDFIWFSTDVFHEEFVDLARLRAAVEAAQSMGIPCGLQIAESAPEGSPFMARLREALGDLLPPGDWYVTPLSALGRAPDEAAGELAEAEAAPPRTDTLCPWLGSPWIHEDGRIVACPSTQAHESRAEGLAMGHVASADWSEARARAEGDGFVQMMRTVGPAGIFESFPDLAPAAPGASICEDCLHVACDAGRLSRVREGFAADAGLRRRTRLMRALIYREGLGEPAVGEAALGGEASCAST